MQPLLSDPYAKAGWLRRQFNRFCDRLEGIANALNEGATTALRAELDEGYREIAEHRDRMRLKYPEAYAEAEKQLRKRYFHFDD